MDPITGAIVAAVAKLAEPAVLDAYNGLKKLIAARFGGDSEVAKSVDQLEANPESPGRKAVLEEEVVKSGAAKDASIMAAVQALQAALEKQGGNVFNVQTGNDSLAVGQMTGGTINFDRQR